MADFEMNIEHVRLEVSHQVTVVLTRSQHRDLPSLLPTASGGLGDRALLTGLPSNLANLTGSGGPAHEPVRHRQHACSSQMG